MGSIYSLTNVKNVCCVQGLQINEINVIAKHIKPWYQTMYCIHAYKKTPLLSFQKMKYVALNQREALWILYYIHNPSSIDLLTTNVPSLQANKRWKSFSGVNHFYIPLFNITTGLEENTNKIDLITQEHFLRTLQKQISQLFLI